MNSSQELIDVIDHAKNTRNFEEIYKASSKLFTLYPERITTKQLMLYGRACRRLDKVNECLQLITQKYGNTDEINWDAEDRYFPAFVDELCHLIEYKMDWERLFNVSSYFIACCCDWGIKPSPEIIRCFSRAAELSVRISSANEILDKYCQFIPNTAEIRQYFNVVENELVKLDDLPANSILMFGAYDNGNIGDIYQALALKSSISNINNDIAIFATSYNKSSTKSFSFIDKNFIDLKEFIYNFNYINRFKCLVIGGGGLLSRLHFPLHQAEWVNNISIPIYILGVGAEAKIVSKCSVLVEKANYVSVRDNFSLKKVKKFRTDADLYYDPILTSGFLELPSSIKTVVQKREKNRICFIPTKIAEGSPNQSVIYKSIASLTNNDGMVLSMFPEADSSSGALKFFDKDVIRYPSSMEEMKYLLEEVDLVVSHRYHGSIISLLCGKKTLGVSHNTELDGNKLESLFMQIGHESHYLLAHDDFTYDNLSKLSNSFNFTLVQSFLDMAVSTNVRLIGKLIDQGNL